MPLLTPRILCTPSYDNFPSVLTFSCHHMFYRLLHFCHCKSFSSFCIFTAYIHNKIIKILIHFYLDNDDSRSPTRQNEPVHSLKFIIFQKVLEGPTSYKTQIENFHKIKRVNRDSQTCANGLHRPTSPFGPAWESEYRIYSNKCPWHFYLFLPYLLR